MAPIAEDQITTGSGIFSALFMFQLHVYDSLYSQTLFSLLTGP